MSVISPLLTHLPDGAPVLIRSAQPSDAAALKEGYGGMSQHSRLMRFLSLSHRLSDSEARRFVSPDHLRHIAIGAAVLNTADDPTPTGIAHAFRATESSTRAELALTVIDDFQGRGIGTLLLGRLLHASAALRIEALDAIVHPRNRAMASLLLSLGADMVSNSDNRAYVLPVHSDPADYPDTRAGDAVRAAWALTPDSAAA